MTFYDSEQFTLSCSDGECDGEMEIDFTAKEYSLEVNTSCPVCEHEYNVILQDFEDEPDDMKHLKLYA